MKLYRKQGQILVTVPKPEITSSWKIAKGRGEKTLWSQLQQKRGFNVMRNFTNIPIRLARKRSDEKREVYSMKKYFFPVVVS